jgi:hypothetical protein
MNGMRPGLTLSWPRSAEEVEEGVSASFHPAKVADSPEGVHPTGSVHSL